MARRIKPPKANLPGQDRAPSRLQSQRSDSQPWDPAEHAIRRLGAEAQHVGHRAAHIGRRVVDSINPFD